MIDLYSFILMLRHDLNLTRDIVVDNFDIICKLDTNLIQN
jgi:hypothetical protein